MFSICRVQNLRETIERLHGIPASKQVLMISGGDVLNPMHRVCSYPSGTDENPIYMFSTVFDPKLLPPWPSECRKYLFVISTNRFCYDIVQPHTISFVSIVFFPPSDSIFYAYTYGDLIDFGCASFLGSA